jgi:hypothetical protein
LKKNNFTKKRKKKEKKGKVSKKKTKNMKKKRGKTLWITVVIHSVLCVGKL